MFLEQKMPADKTLRILHFSENFLPRLGGLEVSIHEMTRSQRELGADSRVLTTWWKPRRSIAFPYPVIQFPKSRIYSNRTWAFMALNWIFWRWRFNIIHCQMTLPCALWALEWREAFHLRKQVRVVVTAAGADLNIVPEIGYGLLLDEANWALARRVLQKADALMPTSANMAARMVELAAGACDKISIIPRSCNVIRLQNAMKSRDRARLRFRLARDNFVIVNVGRPAKVKNHEFLLRVLAAASKHIPQICLLCVGDENEAMRDSAKRNDVENRVFFTGRFPPLNADLNELLDLPHEGLVEAIAASDAGVLTSFVESYNITAAEQGVAGLPLILTQNHGVRDRIPPRFSEFVLNTLDEKLFVQRLMQLHTDNALYRAYSDALKSSFGEFTPQRVARGQLEVYRDLVRSQPPAHEVTGLSSLATPESPGMRAAMKSHERICS